LADGASVSKRERTFELISALVLTLAAVATAWASYQASRWHGEQARDFGRANAARAEATRAAGLANSQTEVDVATFVQWVDAYARDETELEEFYRRRFRDEFRPAVEAWIATRPLRNPDAPLTPFAMPEYMLAARAEAERLDARAAAFSSEANEDIQRADRYVLCVVLFAAALLFAGMSTRLRAEAARIAVLAVGCVLFVGTVVWLGTLPVGAVL
jgi:hypothetical protein